MDCYEVLAQVIALLQREGRTSYRALKRQFALALLLDSRVLCSNMGRAEHVLI